MKIWLAGLAASAIVLMLGAAAAVVPAATAAPAGQLTITGPWQGQDAASFRAVLAGFTKQNPGVTVTYTPVSGDVAAALSAAPTGSGPDLAVLSLPADQKAMASLERAGTLKSIDFAAPAVTADYAYSWKLLGSVDGKLTGLYFKASNRSAFWYDLRAFKSLGVTPPTTWAGFRDLVAKIEARGLSPFAISGGSDVALPNLFQNLYLAFQGNQRYDKLGAGSTSWHDASVTGTLGLLQRTFGKGIAGGTASLSAPYSSAVRAVFGSPQKAYLVPGGSAVLPVLASSNAVRPLSQFGVFAFPHPNGSGPARVFGAADAVVMARDSAAARALVEYLATPAAASIWAGRGGDFLSPNRKVAASAYAAPQMATLAESLAGANTFRFAIADTEPAQFKPTMNLQLRRFLQHTDTVGDVTSRLALAAGEPR